MKEKKIKFLTDDQFLDSAKNSIVKESILGIEITQLRMKSLRIRSHASQKKTT
jgi:hypothetical protein